MTLYEVAQREEREKIVHKIVHNMLQRGFDYQTIADVTALTLEEIAIMAARAS